VAENDMPRAERALRTVLDVDNTREDAVTMIASVLAKQGRHKEAEDLVTKAIERAPTSSSTIRLSLATLLEQQGRDNEAKAQYDKVITDNQLTGATTEMLLKLHMASARLALLYANQGTNLDEALRMASAAKRWFPTDPLFSDILGWVHIRNGRAKLGIPFVEAAIKAEPDTAVFHYHLGAAHEGQANFDKARTELNRALQLDASFMGADRARALLKSLGK
jgi:tetratricopeptide (TPR) repeat protein